MADVFDLGDEKTPSSQRLSSCVGSGGDDKFDVISCMLLLHCVPGNGLRKDQAIARFSRLLKPDGVVLGATVLGNGVTHNLFGRFLMLANNLTGVFHNKEDSVKDIIKPLEATFKSVEYRVVGPMLLFEAKSPKTPGVAHTFQSSVGDG